MNTQSLKKVNDQPTLILYRQMEKTKKAASIFLTILFILLFSCTKQHELPGPEKVEQGLSIQSLGADVSDSEEVVPYNQTLFVPCANGGTGEEVALTGSLKMINHLIYNDRGFTLNYQVVTQGITGVGLVTGEKYQASGGNKATITGEFGEEGQYTRVYIQHFRIIGQNTVSRVLYKIKITITPDGKITTSIEQENVDCGL